MRCSFRKAHSTLHPLFRSIQSTDLSKTYDTSFVLAKLKAHGLDKHSLNLVNDYVSSRKQKPKMVSSYTDCTGISWGISLGSSLG